MFCLYKKNHLYEHIRIQAWTLFHWNQGNLLQIAVRTCLHSPLTHQVATQTGQKCRPRSIVGISRYISVLAQVLQANQKKSLFYSSLAGFVASHYMQFICIVWLWSSVRNHILIIWLALETAESAELLDFLFSPTKFPNGEREHIRKKNNLEHDSGWHGECMTALIYFLLLINMEKYRLPLFLLLPSLPFSCHLTLLPSFCHCLPFPCWNIMQYSQICSHSKDFKAVVTLCKTGLM